MNDTFGGDFAPISLTITMFEHILGLPNNARIQEQLNHVIRAVLFHFPMLVDCITSIGVQHETESQVQNS